jgi:hypothetical protein
MPPKKKLRAGKGAKGTVLTRFIKPKQNNVTDPKHRSEVILEDEFDDERGKSCYSFRFDGFNDGPLLYSSKRYVKILEEGERDLIFDLGEGEGKGMIRWQDSDAKALLYEDLLNGVVPLNDINNELLSLEEIYGMHPEYSAFDFEKFADRLASIRKTISEADDRAISDSKALEKFIVKHQPSFYSHKGYIQWQGSEAQALAIKDIEDGMHDLSIKGGKNKKGGYRMMYESRAEYYGEYPFEAFCDKIRQEIKTKKWKHTLKVKGQHHKSS